MSKRSIILPLFAALLCACGGGGGSSGKPAGPAELRIEVSPKRIDTGDRTHVEVKLSKFLMDQIQLKVRFPIEVNYVLESSFIEVGSISLDLRPRRRDSDSEFTYIVYRLTLSDIIQEAELTKLNELTVHLDLEGKSDIVEGVVSADADIDDGDGFDIEDPLFDPIDEADLTVGPTPTPTPAA